MSWVMKWECHAIEINNCAAIVDNYPIHKFIALLIVLKFWKNWKINTINNYNYNVYYFIL